MVTNLTVSAKDFTAAGKTPRAGLQVRMERAGTFVDGGDLVSQLPWSMTTAADGTASSQLPVAVAGGGVLVNVPVWEGFEQVAIAGYPDGDLSITELGPYIVDAKTLQPSAASLTAWEATIAQVQAIADSVEPVQDSTIADLVSGETATSAAVQALVEPASSAAAAAQETADAATGQLNGRLSDASLSAAYGPGGTSGNVSKSTAQGIALVQALIFGS